ncbi:MAG: N-acetyltransferase [Acidimicrobiia bacterium]
MAPDTDDVVVRRLADDEFPAMRELAIEAFDGDEAIGTLLDTLRGSWAWIDELAFVATRGDEVVGFVLYTSALLDAPRRLVEVLVLSPLGVRTDQQGTGFGNRLVRESLEVVALRPEPLVFLEGSPRYYPRFGFRPGGDLGFRKPSLRIPDAAFMALPLAAHEPWMTGTLVYPDAFWRTDSVGLREEG